MEITKYITSRVSIIFQRSLLASRERIARAKDRLKEIHRSVLQKGNCAVANDQPKCTLRDAETASHRLLFKEKVTDRLTTGKLGGSFASLRRLLAIFSHRACSTFPWCTVHVVRHQPALYVVVEVAHCELVFMGGFYARRQRACSKRRIMPDQLMRLEFFLSLSYDLMSNSLASTIDWNC